MSIKQSPAQQIERLVAEVREGSGVRRDAAVARLRVIGEPAVDRVMALVTADAAPAAKAAALRVLDGADVPRVRTLALTCAQDADEDVAVAAIAVLRTWLPRDQGTVVLETLTGLALDKERPQAIRMAALDALSDLPRHLVQPVLQAVSADVLDPSHLDDPLAGREWLAVTCRLSSDQSFLENSALGARS